MHSTQETLSNFLHFSYFSLISSSLTLSYHIHLQLYGLPFTSYVLPTLCQSTQLVSSKATIFYGHLPSLQLLYGRKQTVSSILANMQLKLLSVMTEKNK